MKHASFVLCAGLLSTAASAQAPAAAPAGPLPTRMQFCQQEVQGLVGDERRAALKTCLVRRAEGERVVRSECQAQLREVPAEPANRQKLMQACEARALAVPSSELPRPMPPVAAPAPAEPAADGSAILRDGVTMPADGEPIPGPGTLGGEDRAVVPLILPDAPVER